MPNFIAVGQTVYEKSVTRNSLRQSKLNIPTILAYGGNHTSVWWDKPNEAGLLVGTECLVSFSALTLLIA